MKKLLFIIFFALTVFIGNAQDHLKFNGIAITGNIEDLTEDLVTTKLKKDNINGNIAMLYGMYGGYATDVIAIFGIPKQLIPFHITVTYPARNHFNELNKQYQDLKQFLIKEYGEPTSTKEDTEFEYNSTFDLKDLGIVELKMMINQMDNHCNSIEFSDKINTEKSEKAMFGE